MYQSFFQFKDRPFTTTVNTARYFPAATIENARQLCVQAIQSGSGPAMVVGRVGYGKTLLCHVLVEQLQQTHLVAQLCSGRINSMKAFYQAILYELQLPYRAMDQNELRLSLIEHLTTQMDATNKPMLLIIDEAHTLALKLLEEIRLLTNLIHHGQPQVQVVLVGGPALEEKFADPKLESFSQRLTLRNYLEPMNQEQTDGYVKSQLVACGVTPDAIFTPDAITAIQRASDGIPRLVNQLCDHALILAMSNHRRQVSGVAIEEAWADLQQLPMPQSRQPDSMQSSSQSDQNNVIEFGGLDEEELDSSETDRTTQLESSTNQLPELPQEDLVDEGLVDIVEQSATLPFENTATDDQQISSTDQVIDKIDQQLEQVSDEIRKYNEVSVEEESAEEEFLPVGAIRPEVEISFEDLGDPFVEKFDEEEVLIDQYAAMNSDFVNRQPHVSTLESYQLSALLDSFFTVGEQQQQPLIDKKTVLHPSVIHAEQFQEDQATQAQEDTAMIDQTEKNSEKISMHQVDTLQEIEEFTPASDPIMPEESDLSTLSYQEAKRKAIVQTVQSDDDMIMIEEEEDELDEPFVAKERKVVRVRRQEYRQLFTKLRHG